MIRLGALLAMACLLAAVLAIVSAPERHQNQGCVTPMEKAPC